jgi:hypothetical protein
MANNGLTHVRCFSRSWVSKACGPVPAHQSIVLLTPFRFPRQMLEPGWLMEMSDF